VMCPIIGVDLERQMRVTPWIRSVKAEARLAGRQSTFLVDHSRPVNGENGGRD
jgi:hypothetical protein